MEVVRVQGHVLLRRVRLEPRRDFVSQHQGPIAWAAQPPARFALAPAAAVARLNRHALLVRVGFEVFASVADDQPSQPGVRNAELRRGPRAVNEPEIFRMGLEFAAITPDDSPVRVPGPKLEGGHGPVPLAPLPKRLGVVVPRPVTVPDGPERIVRLLHHVDGEGQFRPLRHHLPHRPGKELPVADPVKQIPDGVLYGERSGPDHVEPLRMRPKQIAFFRTEALAGQHARQTQRREVVGGSNRDPLAPVAFDDSELSPGDPPKLLGQCRRMLLDLRPRRRGHHDRCPRAAGFGQSNRSVGPSREGRSQPADDQNPQQTGTVPKGSHGRPRSVGPPPSCQPD